MEDASLLRLRGPRAQVNLAPSQPLLFNKMLARVDELQKGVYSPARGSRQDPRACAAAEGAYGGYWGPFVGAATAGRGSRFTEL